MDFPQLAALKREIATLLDSQVCALTQYHIENPGGFRHKFEDTKDEFSKASTATCVQSLVATGCWERGPWRADTDYLLAQMCDRNKWRSAGLDAGNPFTVSFMLEAITLLTENVDGATLIDAGKEAIREAEQILDETLMASADPDSRGSAGLKSYPPTTYLTQLVVRVLKRRNKLTADARNATRRWAWRQIDHELALAFSGSQAADALALAYAVMLVALCSHPAEASPSQNQILRKAVDVVFDAQLESGAWPRSRPLFHYPKVGNAYCFEYEMLTQLLQQRTLMEHVLRHLPELSQATIRLRETAFRFEGGGLGWASGHHPQLQGPESWSTASVYQYLHELGRVLAEAVRESVFRYIGAEYTRPGDHGVSKGRFANGLLDSTVSIGDRKVSLLKTLDECFVRPVANHAARVEEGRALPRTVPMSAVLYGPPGTAKTRLAREIAEYLGWPLLVINPSHLVRFGLDRVQAEVNTVFSMLAEVEQVVVLLDEFDEMVRERTEAGSEALSRFLTTAMLPKLALINRRRRIVFLVATNHIDHFDFAIRRPGRLDLLLQVMPPTTEAKLAHPPWAQVFSEICSKCGLQVGQDESLRKALSRLTFSECEQLVKRLDGAKDEEDVRDFICSADNGCTLKQRATGQEGTTWSDMCQEQESYVRVPLPVEP